jgi:glycosyltransferase involved in cell wall biosynthesis
MISSATHVVVLPSYNTGPKLIGVVAEVLRHWQPVVVVIDGSNDGSDLPLRALAAREPALTVLTLRRNSGKGAAVIAGAQWARERGFTHVLAMDADGQHHAERIAEFMGISRLNPQALILGKPIFPANIPRERLYGRQISVVLVRCAILGRGIDDPLFGFRVYPIGPLLEVLGPRQTARRYDFDAEAAVRLCWAGVRPLNVPAPVRYFSRAEGGVSHFHYLRDNVTLARMHTRLIGEMLFRRAPEILRHRRRWRNEPIVPATPGEFATSGTR